MKQKEKKASGAWAKKSTTAPIKSSKTRKPATTKTPTKPTEEFWWVITMEGGYNEVFHFRTLLAAERWKQENIVDGKFQGYWVRVSDPVQYTKFAVGDRVKVEGRSGTAFVEREQLTAPHKYSCQLSCGTWIAVHKLRPG